MHNETNNDWSMFVPLENNVDGAYVWLVDYNGNVSDKVYVPNRVTVAVTSEVSVVLAGSSAQFTATVKNYKETDAVTWSVSRNQSAETTIDENGVLTISEEESASRIEIIATSVESPLVSASTTISVKPAYALMADADAAYKGDSVNVAVYYKGTKLPTEDYTWSVSVGW